MQGQISKMLVNIATFGAFVLMVLVFGFFLWQTLFSSEKNGEANPENKPTYSEQHRTPEHALGGGSPPSHTNKTEEAIAEYTRWIAIFTMFLVLATVGLFISGERNVEVAGQSANAARKSAEVSENTLIATQRPWVTFEQVNFTTGLIFDPATKTWKTNIEFRLKNTGPSPALAVRTIRPLLFVNGTSDVQAEADRLRLAAINSQKQGQPLFSVGRSLRQPHDLTIDKGAFVEAIKKKSLVLILIGCVDYQFAFADDKPHQTGFVFQIPIEEAYWPFDDNGVPRDIPQAALADSKFKLFPDGWYAN